MYQRAPNYTHVTAGQTDVEIGGGGSITVWGIEVEGSAAGVVLLEEVGTTTVIKRLRVAASLEQVVSNICFLADNGVQITTPANVTCTIYHGTSGA
jgi:uncharacterized protein with ACT and thioredoxin-like domain